MKILIAFICMLLMTLSCSVSELQLIEASEWSPADFQKWQDSANGNLFQQRIGGQLANYPEIINGDTTWNVIDNNWNISGDTMAWNKSDLMKIGVWLDGTSIIKVTWEGVEYTVSQKMIKLIWLNTDTWNWIDVIDSVVWSVPSVDSNIIHWMNIFPAVDYWIKKDNSSLSHGISFKKNFLDSAVTLYDQRSDSLDIALGNVIEYELLNVDHADSAMGNLDFRKLKQLGRYVFELSKQVIHFPGSDTMQSLPVKQRWVKQNGKMYCIEYVMMKHIKQIHEAYPNATIWHNDVTVISGQTYVEDAYINGQSAKQDLNYGGAIYLYVNDNHPNRRSLIRALDIAAQLGAGATITNCVCSLYKYAAGDNDGSVSAYRVFKEWDEGNGDASSCSGPGVTCNDWVCPDLEWGLSGCDSADDGGSDNSGDGTDADRKATAEDTQTPDDDAWVGFDISNALAQAWYDETAEENGIILIYTTATTSGHYFRSTEWVTSNQPFFTFTYTSAEVITRRRRILTGAY